MRVVGQNLSAVAVPTAYAYGGPGSQLATEAGASYMLLEGTHGNILQNVATDWCSLQSVETAVLLLPSLLPFAYPVLPSDRCKLFRTSRDESLVAIQRRMVV